MKLIIIRFKLGRLHEKHVVVTCKFWGLFSICLDKGKPKLGCMCTPLDILPNFEKVRFVGKHFVKKKEKKKKTEWEIEAFVGLLMYVTCLEFCWTIYTVDWDVLFKWRAGH